MSSAKEWAQLVCTTDIAAPPVPISQEKFTIGRAQGCNLSLPENKMVSGQHCVLIRSNDGTVVLQDTSTNGTLINSCIKLTKGKAHRLQHGDEIFLVFKKGDKSKNVAYMFQDLSQLLDETQVNEDPESDEECTQEYEVTKEEPITRPADSTTKRPAPQADPTEVEVVQAKRPRGDINQENPFDESCKPQCHPGDAVITSDTPSDTTSSTGLPTSTAAVAVNVPVTTQQGTAAPCTEIPTSTSPAVPVTSIQAAASSGIGTAASTTCALATAAVDSPADAVTTSTTSAAGDASGEGIADNLICSICQDIFHDCISLQPCLHSFCAACYSSWMDLSKECPTCRNLVERISRNFIVNSLVEAFVKEHPDKKRSEEEIADMNAKNKITRDMMILSKKRRARRGSDEYSERNYSSDDYGDEDDSSDSDQEAPAINFGVFQFGRPAPFTGIGVLRPPAILQPPLSTCMQCPGYIGPGPDAGITFNPQGTGTPGGTNSSSSAATTSAQPPACNTTSQVGSTSTGTSSSNPDQPSTSASDGAASAASTSTANCRGYKISSTNEAIPMPIIPQFVCQLGANHLMCGCCRRQMPDRRQEYFANPQAVPPQKCDVCGNFFCHLYWGCSKLDCNGCLNKFQDLHFGKKCLDNLILKNSYESDIFKDYLKRKNLTWKDVLATCMAKLDANEYLCQDGAINRITSVNTLCYHCGLRNFQELAYQYRKDIPRDDLPPQIVARPDCHWGNKCRTQINKIHHAKNFNHICEQTRF